MHLRGPSPRYHASDLTNFLGCRHLTAVERLAASGLARRPVTDDPMLEILRERGLAHEAAYVAHLAAEGKRVVTIDGEAADPFADTQRAMRSGADVIVQARLEHGHWAGWADVLLRVDPLRGPGARFWRYEPVEAKLATETRGATLLQLALYAELLAALQGDAPEVLRVVVPDRGFAPQEFRFDEFRAYLRWVQQAFEAELATPLAPSVDTATPYPDPVPHCDVCNWYRTCDTRRVRDDHVSLVAGILKEQRKAVSAWGVTTLAALAALPVPLERRPARGSVASLERMREQARVQLASRTTGGPVYELLPLEDGCGLAALPAPSPLDVFLDLEGDRHAEHGGHEYLFGYAFRDEAGAAQYVAEWALTPEEEKAAFERFMDVVTARRARDPQMHVYHYAPYEPTAMKRLMGRYATRAEALDDFLRGAVFVDLYGIVRKGVRAGVDSYSIKKLEPFYDLVREVDLRRVTKQLRQVEYAIATRDAGSLPAEVRAEVQGYNRDDCLSAMELRDWLERLRDEAARRDGVPVPRPGPPTVPDLPGLKRRLVRIREVSDRLQANLPVERNPHEQAQWVLAQLLEWHRREEKVVSWELFRLRAMTSEELVEERDGLGALEWVARLGSGETTVMDRYRYAAQVTEVDTGDEVFEPGVEGFGKCATVAALDVATRTVDLTIDVELAERRVDALFTHSRVPTETLEKALLRLGESVCEDGIAGRGAERDLLLRASPRLKPPQPLRQPGETVLAAACRIVLALDESVLAIQGPPGAGKTFTGARMIVDLVRAGRRVGVTAGSHKVVRNMLDEVVRVAATEGVAVRCLQRVSEYSKDSNSAIKEQKVAKTAAKWTRSGDYNVIGGVAWHWCRENLGRQGDLDHAVHVLFVDEAGQMCLPNVLACAQAARSLVLLGDPQQLEQPQKASHPDGCDLSALEYFLDGHETVPEDRGLFLPETFRLNPEICTFTSEQFYEGRLHARPGLERQVLTGPIPFAGAGLFHVPVAHEGNRNASLAEAACIQRIVDDLTKPGVEWWNEKEGIRKPLTLADILIVAPYNAQVSEIAQLVPGAHVGTVDKFQGQEAPVVIYSMATSSAEDAPRGMDFLFSRHRLNVASSRAKCVCILVANPRLFELECKTLEQMRMANAFCAYLERARVVQGI